MYAYKDRLADGFDQGLTNSMIKYEADDIAIINDFDLMQGKVWQCTHSMRGRREINSVVSRSAGMLR